MVFPLPLKEAMKVGDLVEMYGQTGFYGILLKRSTSVLPGRCWTVLWQGGAIFDREENLMELVSESR